MSPLFMDTGYEPNSPDSPTAEERHSNTAGSERESEGQQMGPRGTKRREKNRDAARKSRRKQTERADELHEELQSIERSNSALQKEIVALKKEFHLYKTSLQRHEPYCRLTASASSSSSSTCLVGSSSADCQTSSSHQRVTEASNSTLAASPALSFSLTPNMGLQSLDCIERANISPPAPAPATTLASPAHSSANLFTSSSSSSSSSSSPVTSPYSASFSTYTAPHSLFSKEPMMTSSPTNVLPVCASLVSNPVPSSVLYTAPQPTSGQDTIHETCYTVDGVFKKNKSFLPASANVTPPYSHLEDGNTGVVAAACPTNLLQLPPCQFSGNPSSSTPPCTFLPSHLQDPAPHSLLASTHSGLEPSPAPSFAPKQSYDQDVTRTPASLLSLLTVPSPLDTSQATSSSVDGSLSQPPSSVPPLRDASKDLYLYDLYDWILGGNNNQ